MIWWLILALLLLIIVKLWPRAIFFILGAALLVGGGAFLWTRHIDAQRAQIEITVTYDSGVCPAARPLSVTILNKAAAPLERLSFSVHAKIPGYSRVITPYTYKQYESDKILAPGESYSSCYALPLMSRDAGSATVDNAALEWSATVDNIYLR